MRPGYTRRMPKATLPPCATQVGPPPPPC
uniref:Uncharacterized protein n=1 Tax=Arundo donax TaxID=35708 RepID=A0A0A8YE60_ARUDO